MMPYMNGIDFIKELRYRKIDVPVLIISAKDQYSDKEAGFKSGADDYMVKPIDLNELDLRITSLFRRAKISNEHKLLSYENKIFTRVQLMDEFWGIYSTSEERTVDTHINRLRDKFKNNPDFTIVTIRGLGYKAVKNHD